MSRRWLVLLTLLVLLLSAAAAVLWVAWPRKIALTVEVSATAELPIKGTCVVDGRSEDVTFTGSREIPLEGYRVAYSLVSTEGAGQFRVRARGPDRTYGSAGSGDPPQSGVRGWVKSNWWGAPPTTWIEAFDRDEQAGWIRPPP